MDHEFRKTRSMLLLLTMSLGLLPGCVDSASNPQMMETSLSTEEVQPLTLWMFNTDIYLKPAAEEVAKEMKVKLNYEFSNPERYKTKIKMAVAANELPDVFTQYSGKSEWELILNAKVAAPLNDVITRNGLEIKFTNQSLIRQEDGNIYSVPYRPEQSQVVLYNKKLMAKLGLQPPANWEELLNMVKTAGNSGIIPIALGGRDRWPGDLIYNTLVLRESQEAYSRAAKGEISFTDKPFVDAADKVIQLVKANAFQEGFLNQTDLEARDLFYTGKALMLINGSWVFPNAVSSLGDDLGYTVFPQTGAIKGPITSNTGERSTNPYGIFVNAQSKQLQKAKEFAVRYSLKINDELVKLGLSSYAQTPQKPQVGINGAYAQYLKDFKNFTYIQPYWYGTIPATMGEAYRDLNQKLYTGTLSSSQYVQMMEHIMRKP
ncbi:extracellular solute-binding protein [Paenibacillus cremeus]|uniref:Extracellular solute-binding protein n=1 Tax=Paenibacillus cremeus TaxID=2163881 RepID=A0A559K618_9BACL|nr:extracellular solute-binding protein [Paenibacillus cremeus]TVY07572.1 extracellular solute-binding protein [Paenibacillus cremeus]